MIEPSFQWPIAVSLRLPSDRILTLQSLGSHQRHRWRRVISDSSDLSVKANAIKNYSEL